MNPNDNWIFSGPRNGLFVRVDGKVEPLRYSVHQSRAYADYLQGMKDRAEARMAFDPAVRIREMVVDALDLCVIALNPEPDKLEFPREVLETKFDVDQLRIIAEEWQKRKIGDPQAAREKDPLLPQTVEAAK